MREYGLFDVLGPIMIGPSSSHTAGACRIARVAEEICGQGFNKIIFYLHGSFAETYLGHGTDKALVAGALGLAPDDVRLRNSFQMAKDRGISFSFIKKNLGEHVHPNTVRIVFSYPDGREKTVTGSSIGGGNILLTEIEGVTVEYTNKRPTMILKYPEQKGVIAFVSSIIAENNYNIESMITQKEGDRVTLLIELDEELDEKTKDEILRDPRFTVATYIRCVDEKESGEKEQ